MPATQRARVLVSTDIGGTDPDDFQSMVHLLLYADVLDIEGLIASPYGKGRAADIHRVIDCYDGDLTQLRRHADFPTPAVLRAVVKQGSLHLADHHGLTGPTEGSEWIVHRARDGDARLLEVLVWGGLDDLATRSGHARRESGWSQRRPPAAATAPSVQARSRAATMRPMNRRSRGNAVSEV